MLRLTRGTDEIVSGLLIAFVGGPVAYSVIAILSMFFMPDLVTIGVVIGLGLFALGLLRALQGVRHFLRNIETAALVNALGTDEVARRDKAHDW